MERIILGQKGESTVRMEQCFLGCESITGGIYAQTCN